MRKAIFFDRDGVLNDNETHVNQPKDLILYDGVKEGLRKAYEAGYDLFVVTNQGGIELGHLTDEDLKKIHTHLEEEVKDYCHFKEIMYCPYFKTDSEDRKPRPGMILKLADKYDIDLKKSWMVGDRDTDITAGLEAGCRTAKIGRVDPRAQINEANLSDRNKKRKVDLEAVVKEILKEC
ncbi:hydrolase, HAD-superfamily, subfamily IIIA [Alkaliphilus metalliredigens QYMF]|uniref:D,D-heptose 1,7-bisphosphate phosphatase n=1 Tax=Alkaliphilus metalliredigens (strain QYMF) TaxID=293826 RepID=A6TMH4_ALKMQ|nr:HAD-IIIA family hydrolase [Alkaliphilus metalliredigens]ABR47392.1 hydrolase, HAD-superfamily, subfamily IIIA [Alkaliphilus metalliredigens QYMF]